MIRLPQLGQQLLELKGRDVHAANVDIVSPLSAAALLVVVVVVVVVVVAEHALCRRSEMVQVKANVECFVWRRVVHLIDVVELCALEERGVVEHHQEQTARLVARFLVLDQIASFGQLSLDETILVVVVVVVVVDDHITPPDEKVLFICSC